MTNINTAETESVHEQKEEPVKTEAKEAQDVMGTIKVYLHAEGQVLDTMALDTVAASTEDIVKEFGLTEEMERLYKDGDSEVYQEAAEMMRQGKIQEAVKLIKEREREDAAQVNVILNDTQEMEQFFEGLNHVNELIQHGIFKGLRKLTDGGKKIALKLFNQSFEGESTHNNLFDNREDDSLSKHDCYVIEDKDKEQLKSKIKNLNLADKYSIIEGKDPQVFILQIHNRNIPFICANAVNENKADQIMPPVANDNQPDADKLNKAA